MKDLLKQAADTIQRLGAAAQDCKSCARLPECNAYQAEGRFENCDYKWVHEDEVADVQPVKRGKWTWDSNAPHREYGAYKCSNCGCHSYFEENYCYNCGSDMRREKSDEQTN